MEKKLLREIIIGLSAGVVLSIVAIVGYSGKIENTKAMVTLEDELVPLSSNPECDEPALNVEDLQLRVTGDMIQVYDGNKWVDCVELGELMQAEGESVQTAIGIAMSSGDGK